ncbi:TetR/AcrR family transcriptional regulator [Agromyces sp. G08B096]|uniref:TetR/AcrR family transcriptional regulator n=1 Tax=Agromyces sp. G08B096 TaxID=3156399 RepID=A0AAU7W8A6_9MICO
MKPGPRRSISQSEIVAAAFEILAERGFAAVSVRGVAGALGLTPTAMYTYFPAKQALLTAMVEQLLAGVTVSGGVTVDGDTDSAGVARSALVETAAALRVRLRAHPGAVALVTSGPLDGPVALALTEGLGASFVAAGLDRDDAARAAHALLAHVLGQVALETAWSDAPAEPASATLWSDETKHPITDAGAALGLRTGDETEFRTAVGRLVDGWLVPAGIASTR